MKFSWFGYWKPTPVLIRKLADSILASCLFMGTYSFANNNDNFAFTIMVIGGIAKLISNFFSNDQA